MNLTININLDNEAFTDCPELELAKIFKKILARIERGEDGSKVIESNGNTCGEWRIEE